jgi:hypothetical protein
MNKTVHYIGLDVHKETIAVASGLQCDSFYKEHPSGGFAQIRVIGGQNHVFPPERKVVLISRHGFRLSGRSFWFPDMASA